MDNVKAQRLEDGTIKVTGLNGGVPFNAWINKNKTGGMIRYLSHGMDKLEALASPTLRYLLAEIDEITTKAPIVLNAIEE